MEKQKRILGLLFLGVFLFSIFSISALLISPANGGTVSGTYILNATNSSLPNLVNCTFYAKSSLTANSSWTSLGTATNESANALKVNRTFASTILEDANNYFFNATCYNSSSSSTSVATTETIIVDNTIPQTPSSLSPSANSVDTDGSISFSGTVTGVNTTSCTLYFSNTNPGSTSYAMTHTGNTCTYSLTAVPDQSYDYYIRASDETNTSDSSTIRFNVNEKSSSDYMFQNKEIVSKTSQSQTSKTFSITNLGENGVMIGWIIGIVLVIVILVIIFKK